MAMVQEAGIIMSEEKYCTKIQLYAHRVWAEKLGSQGYKTITDRRDEFPYSLGDMYDYMMIYLNIVQRED